MKGFVKAETIQPSKNQEIRVLRFDDNKEKRVDFTKTISDSKFQAFLLKDKKNKKVEMSDTQIKLYEDYVKNFSIGFKILSGMNGYELGKGLGKEMNGIVKPIRAVRKRYIGQKGKNDNETVVRQQKPNISALYSIYKEKKKELLGGSIGLIKRFSMENRLEDEYPNSLSCISFKLINKHERSIRKNNEKVKELVKARDMAKEHMDYLDQSMADKKSKLDNWKGFQKKVSKLHTMEINNLKELSIYINRVYQILLDYPIEFLESKAIFHVLKIFIKELSNYSIDYNTEQDNIGSSNILSTLFIFLLKYQNYIKEHENVVNVNERHFTSLTKFICKDFIYKIIKDYFDNRFDVEDPVNIVTLLTSLKRLRIAFCDVFLKSIFDDIVLMLLLSSIRKWDNKRILPTVWLLPWLNLINLFDKPKEYLRKISFELCKLFCDKIEDSAIDAISLTEYVFMSFELLRSKEKNFLVNLVIIPRLIGYITTADEQLIEAVLNTLTKMRVFIDKQQLSSLITKSLETRAREQKKDVSTILNTYSFVLKTL